MKIIIADDHKIIIQGMQTIIKEAFPTAEITFVTDSTTIFSFLKANNYDLLICDITMPGLNGIDILLEVNKNYNYLPVIMMSMHAEEDYAAQVLKAGAHAFLSKNNLHENLQPAIQSIINKKPYISKYHKQRVVKQTKKKGLAALSKRELQVLIKIANGHKLVDIATSLNIKLPSVSTFKQRIEKKLDIKTKSDLYKFVIDNQLIIKKNE
jgi:two-component system, NarL family, invasion response regulator UvrY